MNVDLVVPETGGKGAFANKGKSIGTRGAQGSCIAVAATIVGGQVFVAHISFDEGPKKKITKKDCEAFWTKTNVTATKVTALRYSYYSVLSCTKTMIGVIRDLFGSKAVDLSKQGQPGSVYVTQEGKFGTLSGQNEPLKGPPASPLLDACVPLS